MAGHTVNSAGGSIRNYLYPHWSEHADDKGMGFFESAWQALMRLVDPGTVAGDEGWSFRLFGLLITIVGIFILN